MHAQEFTATLGEEIASSLNVVSSEGVNEFRTEGVHLPQNPHGPVHVIEHSALGNASNHDVCTRLRKEGRA